MKDAYDPVKILAANVTRIVRIELDLTNEKAAEKAGHVISPGSVGHYANGWPNKTLTGLAALARAAGVDLWQLFVTGLPESAQDREHLALLARAFLILSPTAREHLVSHARFLCQSEGVSDKLEPVRARQTANRLSRANP